MPVVNVVILLLSLRIPPSRRVQPALTEESGTAVVIPAYNEEDRLEPLISLRAQACRPWKSLAVADRSTDRTTEIAARWGISARSFGNPAERNGYISSVLRIRLLH